MNIQTHAAEIRLLPLSALSLHPMNPRQNGDPADSAALAMSIEINGLLQNLCALEDENGIGIVAGGRRLRALQHIAEHGTAIAMQSKAPHLDAIPVRVTDDPFLARSWALAEGETQRALHPADQVRAYRAMAEQGNDPDIIARAFAVTVTQVKQRLALGALCEEALDALKAGHITLDVARALTLTDDAARQLSVLTAARAGNWHAQNVRRELTASDVRSDDRKVRFIGVDAYLAAGGTLREDLFEDCQLLHDAALVDKLFAETLAARAEAIRAEEGWSWADTVLTPWTDYNPKLVRLHPEPVTLPEADAEELDRLSDMDLDDMTEAEQARLRELEDRERGDYTDDQRETGGILVFVSRRGELVTEPHRRKGAAKGSDSAATGSSDAPATPPIPQNALDDLRRIRLMALQLQASDKTELLLDLFAWQLTRFSGYAAPLALHLSPPGIGPDTQGAWQVPAILEEALPGHGPRPDDIAADFTDFRAEGRKTRNAALTAALARCLNVGEYRSPEVRQMVETLTGFDGAAIRKVWTPDAATYFGRIRPNRLDAIWRELLGIGDDDDRAASFATLKRAEKAKELEALFTDASVQEAHGLSRDQVRAIDAWLPEEIRPDAQGETA